MLRIRAKTGEWCHYDSMVEIDRADLKGLEKFGGHVDRLGRRSVVMSQS